MQRSINQKVQAKVLERLPAGLLECMDKQRQTVIRSGKRIVQGLHNVVGLPKASSTEATEQCPQKTQAPYPVPLIMPNPSPLSCPHLGCRSICACTSWMRLSAAANTKAVTDASCCHKPCGTCHVVECDRCTRKKDAHQTYTQDKKTSTLLITRLLHWSCLQHTSPCSLLP